MSDNLLDLDAARADATSQPLVVRLGGDEYHVPRPLPLTVAIAAEAEDFAAVIDGLFGGRGQEALAAGITLEDVMVILDRLVGGDGAGGNSDASSPTSGDGGT